MSHVVLLVLLLFCKLAHIHHKIVLKISKIYYIKYKKHFLTCFYWFDWEKRRERKTLMREKKSIFCLLHAPLLGPNRNLTNGLWVHSIMPNQLNNTGHEDSFFVVVVFEVENNANLLLLIFSLLIYFNITHMCSYSSIAWVFKIYPISFYWYVIS